MPSIAIPVSLRGQLLSGARQTLTNILFSANEPGFTFEPWDITTLYQDRAGTTPVTAAGQSVGLRLDKSQGLRIGPELVTNPGNPFTTTTGFTAAASTISLVAGRIKTFIPAATSGAAGIYWDTTVTANKAQKIVMDLEAEGRTFEVRIYNGASFATLLASDTVSAGVRRNVSFTVTPTTSAVRVYILEASGVDRSVYLASVSVRELAGNHEVAVSDAKRGVYGWMPKTGRRNLLTYTEDLSNAAWGKTRITTSGTKFSADSTADTSHSIQYNGLTYSGIASTVSFDASAGEISLLFVQMGGGAIAGFNLATGALTSYSLGSPTATIVSLGSGLYRCTMTATPNSNSLIFFLGEGSGSTLDVTLAGVQTGQGLNINRLQVDAGAATAYQRVVSQYDITEAGVPTCYYVQADGVDDAYVTPTITPNTDKAQVFAGVRKLSDAADGVVIQFGNPGSLNNGSLRIDAPGSGTVAKYQLVSRGTTTVVPFTASATFNAPVTNVVAGLGDISGDAATLRVNGAQVSQSTADQGAGNYLAYPAYLYARDGTTLPFNGLDFGHAVRFGPNLDAATIARVECLIARNTPEVTL